MTYSIGDEVDFNRLHWQSDWNGYEVGHDNVEVIGLYSDPNNEKVDYYINVDTHRIVEILIEGEEDL